MCGGVFWFFFFFFGLGSQHQLVDETTTLLVGITGPVAEKTVLRQKENMYIIKRG